MKIKWFPDANLCIIAQRRNFGILKVLICLSDSSVSEEGQWKLNGGKGATFTLRRRNSQNYFEGIVAGKVMTAQL